MDSFPVLNNSNSRKIKPMNIRNSVDKSQDKNFRIQEKTLCAPKKLEANNRYFSVGITDQKNIEINSNYNSTVGMLSGGMSTNEDTNNSNGAFKKTDEGSHSFELAEKENMLKSNPAVCNTLRNNRLGDIQDKRRLYQSQNKQNCNPL